ncbi:MAG TPA: acetyltransferase [Usitatibacter sp.]|nr:acetyltransferase [Usitatibacter sp.]
MTQVRYYDVFNGDADGICALHQLRLADPLDSVLVTGLKHDIALLDRVAAREGDVVTVLDISLDRNRPALLRLLGQGVHVRYFDHHYAGDIPVDRDLEPIIDTGGAACTSALVDRHLAGRHRAWAVVGAFGDGLADLAGRLAASLWLDADALDELRELGNTLNYNAYGTTLADVTLPPKATYRLVHQYEDPFDLIAREPVIRGIARQRLDDLDHAMGAPALRRSPFAEAYVLPDATWSRRVSGEFANRLAAGAPHKAFAVVTPLTGGDFGVSVRSPRGRTPFVVDLCRTFETGGGRREAAGIEKLRQRNLERFLEAFEHAWAPAEAHA